MDPAAQSFRQGIHGSLAAICQRAHEDFCLGIDAENAAFGGVSGFHRGQTSFQGIDCNRNFHMRFLLFGVLDPIHCYFQMEIETFLDSYASFYYNTIGHWIQYWMLHFRKQIWHLSHV